MKLRPLTGRGTAPWWAATSASHAQMACMAVPESDSRRMFGDFAASRVFRRPPFVFAVQSLLEFVGLARAIGVAPDELLRRATQDLPGHFDF